MTQSYGPYGHGGPGGWDEEPAYGAAESYAPAYYEEEHNERSSWLIAILVLLLAVLVGLVIYFLGSGVFGSSNDEIKEPNIDAPTGQAEATTPAASDASSPAETTPLRAYNNFAPDTDVTSQQFAAEVFNAFQEAYQREKRTNVTVEAFSPVTGGRYTMNCSGDDTVYCSGGNNARVRIW